MNCPACSGVMVQAQATSFGEKYWFCRGCMKELSELQPAAKPSQCEDTADSPDEDWHMRGSRPCRVRTSGAVSHYYDVPPGGKTAALCVCGQYERQPGRTPKYVRVLPNASNTPPQFNVSATQHGRSQMNNGAAVITAHVVNPSGKCRNENGTPTHYYDPAMRGAWCECGAYEDQGGGMYVSKWALSRTTRKLGASAALGAAYGKKKGVPIQQVPSPDDSTYLCAGNPYVSFSAPEHPECRCTMQNIERTCEEHAFLFADAKIETRFIYGHDHSDNSAIETVVAEQMAKINERMECVAQLAIENLAFGGLAMTDSELEKARKLARAYGAGPSILQSMMLKYRKT